MRRLLLLLIVALALAPGTWLRSPRPPADERPILTVTHLPVPPTGLGQVEFVGAWRLESPNRRFGSYSALVVLGRGMLLAGSDKGQLLRFAEPGTPPRHPVFSNFARRATDDKRFADLEALALDRSEGQLWGAFEGMNRIARRSVRFPNVEWVDVPAMHDWPVNTGPEAMTRLADGRFLVLSEGDPRWFAKEMPALLFPGDPLEGAVPEQFRFAPPEGFRPVDAAQLPDGRVLVLLREVAFGLPPRFSGKLVVADPAQIVAGKPWPWRPVADIAAPLPTDNYEGLAIDSTAEGGPVIWLISDDNDMGFQRTLLLKLRWKGAA